MADLVLYTRPDCHLCEVAAELLLESVPGVDVHPVDIEEDLGLIERYGQRVPVLQRATDQAELGWPFSAAELAEFLAGA